METLLAPPPGPKQIETDPNVIELEFTETDRQTAARFHDKDNCIIATALKNRGFNVGSVGGNMAIVEGYHWNIVYLDWIAYRDIDYDAEKFEKGPFYIPSVVGKHTRLTKIL